MNSRAWRRFINSVFTWVSITLAHGLESRTCPKIADNRGPMGTTVMIHHRSSESTTHMTKNSIAFSKVTWHIYQVPLINCRGEKKMVFDRDLKSFPSIRKQVETTKDKTLRSSKSPKYSSISSVFVTYVALFFSLTHYSKSPYFVQQDWKCFSDHDWNHPPKTYQFENSKLSKVISEVRSQKVPSQYKTKLFSVMIATPSNCSALLRTKP